MGVRVKGSGKLVAFISGIPSTLQVMVLASGERGGIHFINRSGINSIGFGFRSLWDIRSVLFALRR